MIEEEDTVRYECTEESPVMEASISHGGVRRSEDAVVTISGAGKRRRFGDEDDEDVFQVQYRSRRDVDVNFPQNVASMAVSGASDHVNSSVVCTNDDSISDLKVECLSETDIFMSSNNGFSRETSSSSVVCLESEELMESLSTSTLTKKKKPSPSPSPSPATATTTTTEATSRRKPPPETTPSAAELEEFFSKAEKYEQKRFTEKYNFDIVKDVPMEGRYQWLQLKP